MAESVLMKDAYHVRTGLTRMYAVDAQNAVSMHPDEWSLTPWSEQDAEEARNRIAERHAKETEDAKARGVAPPPPLPPEPEPPTPEEQAALDQYNADVAAAQERLNAVREKQAEEKKIADQIAADEALVASPPPRPDPTARRRPFGRPGEPTPAELKQIEKQEAKKADDERIAREKADVDRIAGAKVAPTI